MVVPGSHPDAPVLSAEPAELHSHQHLSFTFLPDRCQFHRLALHLCRVHLSLCLRAHDPQSGSDAAHGAASDDRGMDVKRLLVEASHDAGTAIPTRFLCHVRDWRYRSLRHV
eukprot:210639-Rhodomonas_salina.3